jgi:uncharacterized repeat protein (TIGR01451 family)
VTALVASLLAVGTVATPAAAVVPPADNPPIPAQCGLGVTLVLDASGSVQSSNAVGAVRAAAESFLQAFADTGSTARVLQFASLSEELAPRGIVDAASLAPGGVFRQAVDGYYNPIPPRPANVEIKRYNSGNPQSASSWQSGNSYNQYTNWDQSLRQAGQDSGDLVVYITDGDPTAYDFNQPGDPFSPGPPPDVGVGTDRNATVAQVTLDRAVTRANAVKAQGSRILAVGVGAALQNQASVDRLIQISGPDVADDLSEFDVETTDVALVADFDDLADAVRALVLDLCSPSLTIRKFAQSATDAAYVPADGWDVTVTPTVDGGFSWILPSGATGPSATDTTSDGGFAQFQWEPTDDPPPLSDADVVETLEPGFIPGRPGDDYDFRCEFRNADGDVRVVTGELTPGVGEASFALTGIGSEIGTCALFNSFDYEPDIAITKVNAPTEARGDLNPAATVTSTYAVTNPGNTPLDNVQVTDDRCGPVQPRTDGTAVIPGDTNGDAILQTTETWTLTCTREARAGLGLLGAESIVNTVTVTATDPAGTDVTASATDDVDLYVPQITLEKLVDGQPAVTIAAGTPVTYTYAVTNTGDTPLQPVTLSDDTPPCTDPTLEPIPGNGDAILDVGETWNYSCPASPTAPVQNTATVTGTPLNPVTGAAFPDPNPDVTAVDFAVVNLTDPGLTLTKTVDQPLVLPGTTVEYTYVAENSGDTDLRNDTGNAGWVTDDRCSPVTQVETDGFNNGDANQDDLMNPGELWEFTCSTAIFERTVNVGTIIAQPVVGGVPTGAPLTRRDPALVEVPEIGVEKTALVPMVLDDGAEPIAGPDFPTPRPAQYLYQVFNPGTVPIADVELTDDTCAPVSLVSGDDDGDGILAVDEVWVYECETSLDRDQATPPAGNTSGLVVNTATVTGTPFLENDPGVVGPQMTATDTAQVLVIEPSLTLTKTPNVAAVRVNGSVTYTFEVTNTGDVPLDITGLTDDKCAELVYVSGDFDPPGTAGPNGDLDGWNGAGVPGPPGPETWVFECTRSLGLPSAGIVDENTATVTAVDPLGNRYEAVALAEVVVIDPDIHLDKSVDQHLVPVGTAVTYTFAVTNVGRSPDAANDVLDDITLGDDAEPAQPTCTEPLLDSIDLDNGDDLLDRDPAETWNFSCSAIVDADTVDIAGVSGLAGTTLADITPFLVFAFDFEAVKVFHPAIEVVKSADPTTVVKPGGDVTYTYTVRNTGDVPLADVASRITDDTCAPVEYVSGDLDGDGLLDTPTSIFEDAADEVWIFECTMFVSETTTNVVTVTGTPTDPDGVLLCAPPTDPEQPALQAVAVPCEVSDTDTALVEVVEPLPPTGGQIAWTALALALMLGLGGGALLATSRALRRPGE